MPIGAQQSGFQLAFQQFMTYAGPIIQLAFWIGMLVLALLAYLQFKRLVDAKVAALEAKAQAGGAGGTEAGAAGAIMTAAAGSGHSGVDDIAVEEFAE